MQPSSATTAAPHIALRMTQNYAARDESERFVEISSFGEREKKVEQLVEKKKTIYEFTECESVTGRAVRLEEFAGQVVLIVNTASKCKFTRQLDGLQKLYERFRDEGFVILGFPSANFMGQEFADESKTAEFCRRNYGVEFPMFKTDDVIGPRRRPLFGLLSAPPWRGGAGVPPIWNFQKYLVNRQGRVVDFFFPFTSPEHPRSVRKIKALLAEK
jgi:glutathione peroxidase